MKLYWVDAFADNLFQGNPAAVIPLTTFLKDEELQQIATENNLSETAYFVKANDDDSFDFYLRWFTPDGEVNLCGHATLATSFVVDLYYKNLLKNSHEITFQTKSGLLTVTKGKEENQFVMDFPRIDYQENDLVVLPPNILNIMPEKIYHSNLDYLGVYQSEDILKKVEPNVELLKTLNSKGLALTAPGNETDMYSRCFYSDLTTPEDPVTGSAHCLMAPYWAKKMGKKYLTAKQGKKRVGRLSVEVLEKRVILIGKCKLYMIGDIFS